MTLITDWCQDTVDILDDWDETITVQRKSNTYDAKGMAVLTWATVTTFLGDWQPVAGKTMRDEEGLAKKSDVIIIGPCSLGVLPDDKVVRDSGDWWYVNYVREYEDHTTIYCTKQEGAK